MELPGFYPRVPIVRNAAAGRRSVCFEALDAGFESGDDVFERTDTSIELGLREPDHCPGFFELCTHFLAQRFDLRVTGEDSFGDDPNPALDPLGDDLEMSLDLGGFVCVHR
jgi:hypothetical protein